MAFILEDGKRIGLQIGFTDKNGNPAKVDGEVRWTSQNDAIASVLADAADSTKANIDALELGDVQIQATADADLGEGVKELITLFPVTVVAGEAIAGTISPVGEPVDIPAEVPPGDQPHPDHTLPGDLPPDAPRTLGT